MFDQKLHRRALLKGALASLAAIPVVVAATRAEAAAPALDPNDPQAKSLGYVADTSKVDDKANPMHKAEQKCANCVQYQGKAADAQAPCTIFAGKLVNGSGWCKVYAKKA